MKRLTEEETMDWTKTMEEAYDAALAAYESVKKDGSTEAILRSCEAAREACSGVFRAWMNKDETKDPEEYEALIHISSIQVATKACLDAERKPPSIITLH
jgi:hypothetical protein